ncbi:p45 [Hyphantria cunea granulovirus]|uniref:P45 n=1 Tax=Hyphantria cunea granulovirus TaxID=307448 RepID=A0AAE6D0I0_9BBAC|nr:p45 [Hyphantria cunea granulovirus]QBQ01623.1 p45 [Hyphantria cunea granulovirus]
MEVEETKSNGGGEIEYCLKFFKLNEEVRVKFVCSLEEHEIDTLCFLLAEYFEQRDMFNFKGLTFFSRFRYVIDVIKKDYEARSDTDEDVKKIFKLFVDNDFITQVPSFQVIMSKIKDYFKPIAGVTIEKCAECKNTLDCVTCKAAYISLGITQLDETLQNGWNIYFRPMLGIPVLFFALFKSNSHEMDQDVFNVDNIITNTLLQFFYNLLCDKATPMYWNFDKCRPLITNAQKYILGMNDNALERLLINLNTNTYSTKIYAPLRQFMEQNFSNKQSGKLVHKLFIGFFMRIYLEARKRIVMRPYELETRNVCRVIFKDYSDAEIDHLIKKLDAIKLDLAHYVAHNFVIPKECVIKLFNKHDLHGDISQLLQKSGIY